MKCLSVFLIVLLFCFTSCDSGLDKPTIPQETTSTTVSVSDYTHGKLQIPHTAEPNLSNAEWDFTDPLYVEHGIVYLRLRMSGGDMDKAYRISYDDNGSVLQTDADSAFFAAVREQNPGRFSDRTLFSIHHFSDGTRLLFAEDRQREVYSFHITAEDGTVTQSSEEQPLWFDSLLSPHVIVCDNDTVVIWDDTEMTQFYLLDRTLLFHGAFTTASPIFGAFVTAEGALVLYCEDGSALMYDAETDTVEPIVLCRETEARKQAAQILYAQDAVYLIGTDGIRRQTKDKEELLMTWESYGVRQEDVTVLSALPDDRFLAAYYDVFMEQPVPIVLMPAERLAGFQRETVQAACMNLSHDEQTMLQSAIMKFNQTNSAYQIHLTDYETVADASVGNAVTRAQKGLTIFRDDLLAGVTYDLLFIGNANLYHTSILDNILSGKDLFADLSALGQEIGILDTYLDAMPKTTDGKITALPVTARISALLTTTDVLPKGEPMTIRSLRTIAEGLSEGQALFGGVLEDRVRAVAQTDFADLVSGTCTFDSPEYLTFLSFLDDIHVKNGNAEATRYRDIRLGKLSADYGSGLAYETDYAHIHANADTDPIRALNDGTLQFVACELNNADAIKILLYLMTKVKGETRLCGFPAGVEGAEQNENGYVHFTAGTRLMMMKNAPCKTGAEAFVTLFYGDDIHASVGFMKTSLPVTEGAWSSILREGYYYIGQLVTGGDWNIVHFNVLGEESQPTERYGVNAGEVFVSDAMCREMHDFLTGSDVRGAPDITIETIIDEELSAVQSGIRSREEAAKIIQSRASIYLSE